MVGGLSAWVLRTELKSTLMPMVVVEHALDVDGVVAVAAEERLASRQKTTFLEEDEAPRASPIVASVHDGDRWLAISFLIGWMRPR